MLAVIAAIVFGFGALGNDDPLWFYPSFTEIPRTITVYQSGCVVELLEGQSGFDGLTQAVNQSLVQIDGLYGTYGLSVESLENYRAHEGAVEISYGKPVTIHTPYRFGHPDILFIPLSGAMGEARAVFGGVGDSYWASALRLKSNTAIQRAAELILCVQ